MENEPGDWTVEPLAAAADSYGSVQRFADADSAAQAGASASVAIDDHEDIEAQSGQNGSHSHSQPSTAGSPHHSLVLTVRSSKGHNDITLLYNSMFCFFVRQFAGYHYSRQSRPVRRCAVLAGPCFSSSEHRKRHAALYRLLQPPTFPLKVRARGTVIPIQHCFITFCLFGAPLILATAYVNLGNTNGKTALMFAAQLSSSQDLVSYLLSLGADPNVTNNRGHSALMLAVGMWKHPENMPVK